MCANSGIRTLRFCFEIIWLQWWSGEFMVGRLWFTELKAPKVLLASDNLVRGELLKISAATVISNASRNFTGAQYSNCLLAVSFVNNAEISVPSNNN